MIVRGDIWWADLAKPVGSEPGYRRPVVIVQIDRFNSSRIATVLVVPLTTNVKLAQAPGNVLVAARHSGLPKDSVANVSQLFAVDKSRLAQRVGKLTGHAFKDMEDGLRLIMGL